eukprot:1184210-Prorocentrum_minimum.AAC.1
MHVRTNILSVVRFALSARGPGRDGSSKGSLRSTRSATYGPGWFGRLACRERSRWTRFATYGPERSDRLVCGGWAVRIDSFRDGRSGLVGSTRVPDRLVSQRTVRLSWVDACAGSTRFATGGPDCFFRRVFSDGCSLTGIDSFVVEDPATKAITDFVSYYTLPSTIIGNDQYKQLKAAYCYYYVANTVNIRQLMYEALVMAKLDDYDVFNGAPPKKGRKGSLRGVRGGSEGKYRSSVDARAPLGPSPSLRLARSVSSCSVSLAPSPSLRLSLAPSHSFALVVAALDIMENVEFLKDLKFGIGDGHLQYYIYNWRIQGGEMQPPNVGLVLL